MFSIEKLSFTFPENGITAVDEVSLTFEERKMYAILGENGAGKSTLARLCTGHLQADSGRLYSNGTPLSLRSVACGIANGLVLAPQHPLFSAELTVWENLVIGLHTAAAVPSGFLHPKKAPEKIAAALEQYGIRLPLLQKAGTLDTAQLHWAAIGEALLKQPSVFFLDEPSASFSPQEITQLYGILRACADRGMCIAVITHRIQEAIEFMDAVHILQKGKAVRSAPITPQTKTEELLSDMFASQPLRRDGTAALSFEAESAQGTGGAQPHGATCNAAYCSIGTGKTGLTLSHLTATDGKGIRLSDFSLTAPCGMITGVAGIKKQGIELLEDLLIQAVRPESGGMYFNGQPLAHIRRDVYAYIPSKRIGRGVAYRQSIEANLCARARDVLYKYGVYSKKAAAAWKRGSSFDIQRSWADPVASLSGGMMQKLIFSRELDNPPPRLIICAEPYWGLDRKVQAALLQKLRNLAANGAAVIVLTSDIDAAIETCDCIHVVYRGTRTCFMERPAYDRTALTAAMIQADKHE